VEGLEYYGGENATGQPTVVTQPQFGTVKSTSTLQLKSGERRLIAANKPKQMADEWVLFILGAEIFPAKAH
jgi:hypothetical protein